MNHKLSKGTQVFFGGGGENSVKLGKTFISIASVRHETEIEMGPKFRCTDICFCIFSRKLEVDF